MKRVDANKHVHDGMDEYVQYFLVKGTSVTVEVTVEVTVAVVGATVRVEVAVVTLANGCIANNKAIDRALLSGRQRLHAQNQTLDPHVLWF